MENSEDLVYETRMGFEIHVNPIRKICTVSRGGQIETARGAHGSSIQQEIPCLLFIGRRFEMLIRTGEFALVNTRQGKVVIPYKMWPEKDIRNLHIGCGSMSDQFPVFINHFETVKLFDEESKKEMYQYVFIDPDVSNYQRMVFSVKNPHLKNILILGPKKEEKVEDEVANDSEISPPEEEIKSEEGEGDIKSQNPIFQARVYLRRREPEKVKQMLMDYVLSAEDINIIRAFVRSMMEEGEAAGQRKIKAQLRILDELLRLHSLMTDQDKVLFESELDKGLSAAVAIDLIPIVEQLRNRVKSKEEEIVLWEWEYRLGKMTGMKTGI